MPDESFVPVSAVEHWAYCPRQYALIHLECVFDDSVATLEGRSQHAAHDRRHTTRKDGVRTEHALPIWCDRLGLSGRADAVEFSSGGRIVPVERKHSGKGAGRHAAELQLAAQAACLEEMYGACVSEAAVYASDSRQRDLVSVTPELMAEMESVVAAIRSCQASGSLPGTTGQASLCRGCSLQEACQPALLALKNRDDWLEEALEAP